MNKDDTRSGRKVRSTTVIEHLAQGHREGELRSGEKVGEGARTLSDVQDIPDCDYIHKAKAIFCTLAAVSQRRYNAPNADTNKLFRFPSSRASRRHLITPLLQYFLPERGHYIIRRRGIQASLSLAALCFLLYARR